MVASEIESFSSLVAKIYEGSTDPHAWPDITSSIAKYLGADKALLLSPLLAPSRGGFAYPFRIDESHLALWERRFLSEDIWARRFEERGLMIPGNVVLGRELVTEAELLESAWYTEFLSLIDIFHLLTGVVFVPGESDLPFTAYSFYRGRNAKPFDDADKRRLGQLMPHLSRALGVMFRLRDAENRVAASLRALNEIRYGVLLLNSEGGVCFANAAAERILQRADGLKLDVFQGSPKTLLADDVESNDALLNALRSGIKAVDTDARHFAQTVVVRRTDGSAGYTIQVSHLPESNPYRTGAIAPSAVVFIKDSAANTSVDIALLQRAYGLTQAEARAAAVLCDGAGLDAVAAQLKISPNTIKTHLKSIYAKTAVDSRVALTKLLLSLAG